MWFFGCPSVLWRIAAGLLSLALNWSAVAAEGGLPSNTGDYDRSPQWELLKTRLFGARPVLSNPSQIELVVPTRAAFGATVPVKVRSKVAQGADLYVKRMYLVVDKNPSPIAATIDLSREVGNPDFETRIRVDEYSHVRIVAELSNGELHMAARYVKVSGGCSAPPNREKLHEIGKINLRMPEEIKFNQPNPFTMSVRHPNDTGFELNHITVMFIPPHFVRSMKVSYAGKPIWSADLDFSISENPMFRLNFLPKAAGELRIDVEDSKDNQWVNKITLPGNPS